MVSKRLRKLILVVGKLKEKKKSTTIKNIMDRMNMPPELAFQTIAEAHILHLMNVPQLNILTIGGSHSGNRYAPFQPYFDDAMLLLQAELEAEIEAERIIDKAIEIGLLIDAFEVLGLCTDRAIEMGLLEEKNGKLHTLVTPEEFIARAHFDVRSLGDKEEN